MKLLIDEQRQMQNELRQSIIQKQSDSYEMAANPESLIAENRRLRAELAQARQDLSEYQTSYQLLKQDFMSLQALISDETTKMHERITADADLLSQKNAALRSAKGDLSAANDLLAKARVELLSH